jgi:hypothetical protein
LPSGDVPSVSREEMIQQVFLYIANYVEAGKEAATLPQCR